MIIRVLLSSVLLAGMAQQVQADSSKSEDDWHFSLAPLFLWGMGIEGATSIGPSTTPLNVEFKDALDNLDAVFTFHFEARKKNLTLFAEYQFVDLSPSAELPTGDVVDIGFKNRMMELGAGYRVAQLGEADLEIIGGGRWVEQELKVSGVPLPPLSSLSTKEDWWDLFAGVRLWAPLSDKWSFIGRVDYGAGGSDGTWNLAGMFDYRFKEWGSVFMGYRWMDFDYESGSGLDRYAYDATQQGPLAGLTLHW